MNYCNMRRVAFAIITLAAIVASDDNNGQQQVSQLNDLRNDLTDEDKRAWQDLNSAWGKRAWQDLNSAWGKRAWQDLNSAWGKRAWQDLNSAWGKRAWQDLNSAWGKRAWQDLNSAWGKRAWQDLNSAWGKRAWQSLHGAWGKRNPADLLEYVQDVLPQEAERIYASNNINQYAGDEAYPDNAASLAELAKPTSVRTQPEKKAWNSLRSVWGKRPVKGNNNGPYWKREPGWTNLRGLWGKRSYQWDNDGLTLNSNDIQDHTDGTLVETA